MTRINSTYSPVGATGGEVMTQGIDFAGISNAVASAYGSTLSAMKSSIDESNKAAAKAEQNRLTSEFQLAMEDVRMNPNYVDSYGNLNSEGIEASRAIKQKYGPLVGGSEIRAVTGDTKTSIMDTTIYKEGQAELTAAINRKVEDDNATNQRLVELAVSANPALANASYNEKLASGRKLADEGANLSQTLQSLASTSDSKTRDILTKHASDSLTAVTPLDRLMGILKGEGTERDYAELRQTLEADMINKGYSPTKARTLAENVTAGYFASLNNAKKNFTQLQEQEQKMFTLALKGELFEQAKGNSEISTLLAFSEAGIKTDALATIANKLFEKTSTENFRITVNGGRRYEPVKDDKEANKNAYTFALNYGNELTRTSVMPSVTEEIAERSKQGDFSGIHQLAKLPSQKNILQQCRRNQAVDDSVIKQSIITSAMNEFSQQVDRYITPSFGGDKEEIKNLSNRVMEDLNYLGVPMNEVTNAVNDVLKTKDINGVPGHAYTPSELVSTALELALGSKTLPGVAMDTVARFVKNPDDHMTKAVEGAKESIKEIKKSADASTKSMISTIQKTAEYKDFMKDIVSKLKEGVMTDAQAENEESNFLLNMGKKFMNALVPQAAASTLPPDYFDSPEGKLNVEMSGGDHGSGYVNRVLTPAQQQQELQDFVVKAFMDRDITEDHVQNYIEQQMEELPLKERKSFKKWYDKQMDAHFGNNINDK